MKGAVVKGTVVPIIAKSHALDHVLDARRELALVRDSDLAGGQIHVAAVRCIVEIDELLTLIRALRGASS